MFRFLSAVCLSALFVFALTYERQAFAQKRGIEPQGNATGNEPAPQALLLIQIANDTSGKARERRFADELRMSLDELTILDIPFRSSDFGDLALGRQIATVRPLIDAHRAVAAIWLTEDSPTVLLLHLVAVTTGRALVRIVETDMDRAGEAELAASARELLGNAYLFDISSDKKESPVGRVVESLRHAVAPAVEAKKNWAISVTGRFKGGVYGHEGPALWLGPEAGLEGVLVGGLHARGIFGALAGPLATDESLDIHGWILTPGLGLFYLWEFSPVSLGLGLDVHALWWGLTMQAGEGSAKKLSEWQLSTAINANFRWDLTTRLGLALSAGIEGTPHREIVHRRSDESIIYATPFVSFELGLGLILYL